MRSSAGRRVCSGHVGRAGPARAACGVPGAAAGPGGEPGGRARSRAVPGGRRVAGAGHGGGRRHPRGAHVLPAAVDALAQVNRATRNNVAGLLFPQGLPDYLGFRDSDQYNPAANSGEAPSGLMVAWEPFDFGVRSANVDRRGSGEDPCRRRGRQDAARGGHSRRGQLSDPARGGADRESGARPGVDRSEVFLRVVESLVQAEIRPGVELSRARAEDSAARTQLIQARQAVAVAQALLASLLGLEPSDATIAPGPLLGLPPAAENAAGAVTGNPAALEQDTAIQEARARLKSVGARILSAPQPARQRVRARLRRSRGWNDRGRDRTASSRTFENWAVGFTASFPVMDFASLGARRGVRSGARRRGDEPLPADRRGPQGTAECLAGRR